MIDMITGAIAVLVPSVATIAITFKKILFYYRAIKQAVEVFHEVKESNLEIFMRVRDDPNRKELSIVLSGGIKKIEALPNID